MTSLFSIASALADPEKTRALPPVEKWNPDYCGELDLVIRADGAWIHEGTPIGRPPLIRLFSTVLKREENRYFLVTPHEKLGITVEDVPFLAVLMEREGTGQTQTITFVTNVGDTVMLSRDHLLEMRPLPDATDQWAPYIPVRSGLEARVSRSLFYDLVNLAEHDSGSAGNTLGVWSSGSFFPLSKDS